MKLNSLLQPKPPGQVQINLANLSVADALFLNGVIATFCDPKQNINAECLRSGLAYLAYGQGGKCQVIHRLDAVDGPLSGN